MVPSRQTQKDHKYIRREDSITETVGHLRKEKLRTGKGGILEK